MPLSKPRWKLIEPKVVCSTASSICMCCCMLCCTKCCWVCRLCLPNQSAHFCRAASVPLYTCTGCHRDLVGNCCCCIPAQQQHQRHVPGMAVEAKTWSWVELGPLSRMLSVYGACCDTVAPPAHERSGLLQLAAALFFSHCLHCTATSPIATDDVYIV